MLPWARVSSSRRTLTANILGNLLHLRYALHVLYAHTHTKPFYFRYTMPWALISSGRGTLTINKSNNTINKSNNMGDVFHVLYAHAHMTPFYFRLSK